MARRIVIAGLVLAGVVALAGAAAWHRVQQMLDTRPPAAADAVVVIEPGESARSIATRVVAAGVVSDTWLFRFALWRSGRDRELQAGEYVFDAPLSPLEVVAKIADGRVRLRTITFREGLTVPEMADVYGASAFGEAAAFTAAASRGTLVADLDPDAADLEGYLFPETYALPRDATADDLVEAMVRQFRTVFDTELRRRAAARALTVRNVVTLASIIEKETGASREHAIVSAVFHNRLRLGMPLQSDPTVIFALTRAGLYDGNLTRTNLRYDSPYNTYRYPALPPGPIAAPGAAALAAALAPADVSYLYFVSRNDGTHAFADTLREHNRNVREFQIDYFRRARQQP